MPLVAVAAQNYFLDQMWADQPGDLVEVGLLTNDPRRGGVELATTGGYDRLTVTDWAGFWTAATGGVKRSSVLTLAASTDTWPAAAAWEGIWVDGVLWDAGPLVEPVIVSGAAPGVRLRLSRRFTTDL